MGIATDDSKGRDMLKFLMMVFVFVSTSITPALAAERNGVDSFFGTMNDYLATVLFYDVFPGEAEFPFIVAWLSIGAISMTDRKSVV